MIEEPADDTEDLAALDSLLHKYGASSSASKHKEELSRESSSVECLQQTPSKSFLKEIQERAQILSVQRERSAKKTLQTIVKEPKSQHSEDLDDFVKLIRSAPISDDLYHPESSPVNQLQPLTPTYSRPGLEPGTSNNWSDQFSLSTHVLLDIDNQESKDYSDDSDSEDSDSDLTVTEETDADSDASELNYTWDLNTDLESESIKAQSSGYFELDSLDDAESSTDTDGYFHLQTLDDTNLSMAEQEQPVSVLEDNVHDEVVALSDDESVPSGDDADGVDENVMDVDDSRKSFKTTLGDEKALDAVIDDMNESQNTAQEEDDVVSGDETTNTKKPATDEDDGWVMLSKEHNDKDMEVDDNEDEQDNEDTQDKEDRQDIETEQNIVDNKDDIKDESKDAKVDMEDEHKDKKMKMEEDASDVVKDETMESLKDEDDSTSEDEAVDSGGDTPTDTKDAVESSDTPPEDVKEEKGEAEKGEEDEEDTVVLRNKAQGSLHPQQRYSLPEFDIFDSTKRLDTEMLKSRARLGKQGALAQRRKPTKPNQQDPSRRQTWMFGDPNDTKRLLNMEGIDEEEETPIRARIHSEPQVSITPPTQKPRKPIGGIGGPMLLAGLGGPHMLKKTPKKSPMEDKPHEDKSESPRLIKPKPARPTPALRPKPSQQPLTLNQPPPWVTKPKPKPRPGNGEKPNHDILNAHREAEEKKEESKVPTWMADAKMRLPPISPKTENKDGESSEKDSDSTNKDTTSDMETTNTDSSSTSKAGKKPAVIPQWKQELLKKKKEGDTTGNKKRHSMPPPVAKKPDAGSSGLFTTMPQWQVDLAEKKTQRKQKETEIGSKQESPKVPAWKREAAERAARIQKQQEEQIRLKKEREEKAKMEREEKAKTEKKEESAPLSPMQTSPSAIIKNNTEEEEKQDKPKSPLWKEENSGPSRKEDSLEKTKKDKNTENKAPKVPGKKPILSPKPKPIAVQMRGTNNDDIPQWKKDLVKKRRTSDWRSRLRSASIDQEPPSPTSKTNEESNKLNESQNSTSDKESKRHTICTITDLPVKIPRNPIPSGNVPQWKLELERKNRRLAEHMAKIDSVPDN